MPEQQSLDQSVQSRNRQQGADYERRLVSNIAGECTFAGRVGETKATHKTPDVVCLQDGTDPKVRLIEAKMNGYVAKDQRDILEGIARNLPDHAQMEVVYGPDQEHRVIHEPGQDADRTRQILDDEFNHKKV